MRGSDGLLNAAIVFVGAMTQQIPNDFSVCGRLCLILRKIKLSPEWH